MKTRCGARACRAPSLAAGRQFEHLISNCQRQESWWRKEDRVRRRGLGEPEQKRALAWMSLSRNAPLRAANLVDECHPAVVALLIHVLIIVEMYVCSCSQGAGHNVTCQCHLLRTCFVRRPKSLRRS